MASKPRTNSDALMLWADSMLDRTPCASGGVNSIDIRGDVIYHYGTHYPMAMIERKTPKAKRDGRHSYGAQNGPVVAVYVNSTEWRGASGWGSSTWQVKSELTGYIKANANRIGVPVIMTPLTGDGPVLVENVEGDDIPVIPELDIPVCPLKNPPRDPGPEPVKDPAGCIAGTTIEYETMDYRRVYDYDWSQPSPQAFVTLRDRYETGELVRVEHRAGVERIYYGVERWGYGRTTPAGHKHVQCPHCAAFDVVHGRWSSIMNGGYNNPYQMGWKQYTANIELHGSIEAWRKARTTITRLRKERKAELAEWMGRNSMPFHSVPNVTRGNVRVPDIDPVTGRVKRSVLEKAERERKAADRRAKRELRERRKREAEEEKRREAARVEMRKRLDAGMIVDPEAATWLADHGVSLDDEGRAIMYKRVHNEGAPGEPMHLVSRWGYSPFTYKIGFWAIAQDYQPTRECGHGLHFAESPEATQNFYGETIIECRVPVASIVAMGYKIKAERAFVVGIYKEN